MVSLRTRSLEVVNLNGETTNAQLELRVVKEGTVTLEVKLCRTETPLSGINAGSRLLETRGMYSEAMLLVRQEEQGD